MLCHPLAPALAPALEHTQLTSPLPSSLTPHPLNLCLLLTALRAPPQLVCRPPSPPPPPCTHMQIHGMPLTTGCTGQPCYRLYRPTASHPPSSMAPHQTGPPPNWPPT